MILRLPYPPTANHYKGRRRGGGYYLKPAATEYHAAVAAMAHEAEGDRPTGRLRVQVVVYPPTEKRGTDLDNSMKVFQDALQRAGIIRNDADIDWLEPIRGPRKYGGGVTVRITEVDPEALANRIKAIEEGE